MLEKAQRLLKGGRVERIGEGIYNVIGDHGTYTVAQDHTGRVTCSCPGFQRRGVCSHSAAIIMLTKIRTSKMKLL